MAEEKIRVLIVDDIPETRENLRKLLYFETDIEVVAAAVDGQDGIKLAKEYQPHVVLMDINMPGLDGIAATEAISQEVPFSQVIMMSVQGESDYLRRSMLAGARQFLIKPFSGDELVSTIRRVHELAAKRQMTIARPVVAGPEAAVASFEQGKVIAVFSPKGGAGCTVVATNLAIALQQSVEEEKAQVVLLDASLQFGGVGVMMHLQPSRSIADLAPHIDELAQDMFESTLLGHESGVKCLLAPPRPEMADLITAQHLQTILKELRRYFDYIIVDTWSSLNDLVLGVALEYSREKIFLVLNKMDRNSRITAKDISKSLKHQVVGQIILEERGVAQSVNRGTPLVQTDRKSTFTQNIYDLARHILQDLEGVGDEADDEQNPDDRSRRSVGRLFS